MDSSDAIVGEEDDDGLPNDLSTKKVRFKKQQMASNLPLVVDLDPAWTISWKGPTSRKEWLKYLRWTWSLI